MLKSRNLIKKMANPKFALFAAFALATVLIVSFIGINDFKVLAFDQSQADKPALTLRESIEKQENAIRAKKYKDYPGIAKQTQESIENSIIDKTKSDPSFHNKLPNIPNAKFEQIIEFDESSIKNSDDILSVVVFENRLVAYEDGQTGSEKIRYDLTWNTAKNEAVNLDEYDSFGQKIDKNLIKPQSPSNPEDDKAQEQAFYNRFGGNKVAPVGEVDYSSTIPKELQEQKKFFEKKINNLLNRKVQPVESTQAVPLTKQAKQAKADNAWNGEIAAAYALDNARKDYPDGYSNYEASLIGNGGDCTNFASQVLFAGGLKKDYGNNDTNLKDWYFHWDNNDSARKESATWINASKNSDHMFQEENVSPWYRIYPNNAAQILDLGDIIYINDGKGTTHHAMIVTGARQMRSLGYWDALYSQHTSNIANKSFTEGYNSTMADDPGSKFYGLKFKSPVR